MTDEVRLALLVGIALGVLYLVILGWRRKGLKGSHISEAVGLTFTPFPIPGAVEMIYKAFGKSPLPIFNEPESRAALVIGGLLLIAAFIYGAFVAINRARLAPKRSKPSTGAS
jgi:hypothetical protein